MMNNREQETVVENRIDINIYDLETREWSSSMLLLMNEKRDGFAAAATIDEKLYIFGGIDKNAEFLYSSCEMWYSLKNDKK